MRQIGPLTLVVLVMACRVTKSDSVSAADSTLGGALQHPTMLAGRWVRLREDKTWGDTLGYQADGRVVGSAGHAVPESARWGVRAGPPEQTCFGDAREGGMCRTFELRGDTLLVDNGPSAPTVYRRVAPDAPAT